MHLNRVGTTKASGWKEEQGRYHNRFSHWAFGIGLSMQMSWTGTLNMDAHSANWQTSFHAHCYITWCELIGRSLIFFAEITSWVKVTWEALCLIKTKPNVKIRLTYSLCLIIILNDYFARGWYSSTNWYIIGLSLKLTFKVFWLDFFHTKFTTLCISIIS